MDETGVWDDHVYTSTDERKDFEVVWKSRKNKLIWRGGFHGEARPLAHEFLGDRNLVPRARAAKASLQHSEIIDVKLVGNPEFDKLDARLYGDRVSYEEQLRGYNYALNIDGYGPSSRLRTQLAAGVLVFKVDSVMKAHYMEGMVPWVHYVPVSWGDLENDLIRKVKWASTHDEAAQRIALEGQRYARQYLTDASTAQYMSQVIRTFGDAETSDQPFELIPGSIPFCCQHLEAYNLAEYKPKHGMSGKEYFMKLCLDFTAGWAPPCPHITDDAESEINPADVAIAV